VTEHRLGPSDDGRTVEVAAGDRLVVVLDENPGTGYTWTIDELPSRTRVVDEHYEQAAGAGIGASSRHVFVLEGVTDGRVRLRHGRPWEGEDGVTDRFEVVVWNQSGVSSV
jgi:predicted secreted protein